MISPAVIKSWNFWVPQNNDNRKFTRSRAFISKKETIAITPTVIECENFSSKLMSTGGGVVIRSCTKPPGDLITTHFRGNLKIVGPYSPTFPAPKKIVRPYKHPVSGAKKESETL